MTLPHPAPAFEDDEAFCVRLLPQVSRTFALSIELLPDALREPVRVGYLLCRVVDTIEDDAGISIVAREALFDAFDAALRRGADAARHLETLAERADLGTHAAERELVRHAGAVFRRFDAQPPEVRAAMTTPILEMSRGMRAYARRTWEEGRLRLADVADLERYCYFVAGTVGELLTALFLRAVPELSADRRAVVEANAVPFGLALQVVNIVKDCAEDLERGVCFVPEAVVRAHGLVPEQLVDPAHREPALAAVAEVCAVAAGHLARAMTYTAAWPADVPNGVAVRLFCLVPLVLAFETLAVVLKGDDTLRPGRTPKVSREVVATVFERCREAAAHPEALRRLAGSYGLDVSA